MCVMSAVTDHYQRQWPVYQPFQPIAYPFLPSPTQLAQSIHITLEQWNEYQQLKQAAAMIDRITGQPDCVKEGVDEWEAKIKEITGFGNATS